MIADMIPWRKCYTNVNYSLQSITLGDPKMFRKEGIQKFDLVNIEFFFCFLGICICNHMRPSNIKD